MMAPTPPEARAVGLALLLAFRGSALWGLKVILGPGMTPVDPPCWMTEADIEAHEGRGFCDAEPGPERAIRFASSLDAMNFWKATSVTRPTRPDGRPNRPLTALTVSPERIP